MCDMSAQEKKDAVTITVQSVFRLGRVSYFFFLSEILYFGIVYLHLWKNLKQTKNKPLLLYCVYLTS